MQPDLLQQLRDIHLPAEPALWPPAPGWWLLALAGLVLLVLLLRRIQSAIRRRRPIRLAGQYYATLYGAYERGEIDAIRYLHETNELLKRLYVHGVHDDSARPLADDAWLAYLDQQSGTTAFSEGIGHQLGNQRFRQSPEADPASLHPHVLRLFKAARR